MTRRRVASVWLAIACHLLLCRAQGGEEDGLARLMIGYTELQSNLPGGRHANVKTSRACVIRADGTGHRAIAPNLARAPDTWTQFAGWSPDGGQAIIGAGWQDPINAQWEEEHQQFRMEAGKWRYDCWLLDMASSS